MSLSAKRFHKARTIIFGSSAGDLTKFFRGRLTKDTPTNHHWPPRSKGWNPKTGIILRKRLIDHLAFHQLFNNVGTKEEIYAILERDWFNVPKEEP